MAKRTLCIVPCGKEKIWDTNPEAGPTPAKDVYVGGFSEHCQRYAKRFYPNNWCILSAKHGYLFPEEIVPGPYDVTFSKPSTNPISVEELRAKAGAFSSNYDRIVIVAGHDYAEAARLSFPGKEVCTPLAGLKSMGHMHHALAEALSSGTPLPENCF